MRRFRLVVAIVALVSMIPLGDSVAGPAERVTPTQVRGYGPQQASDEAASAGATGRIALTSDGIVTVRPDGSGAVRLTRARNDYHDSDPTFSPDGSKIAFMRAGDLYVMNHDGSKVHRVSGPDGSSGPPRWSPNGRWIAFVDVRQRWGKGAITIVRPNGNDRQRLTAFASFHSPSWRAPASSSFYPSWSPDSRRIFYDQIHGGGTQIFVMDRDGSDKTQLTDGGGSFLAETSPDGSKILFTRNHASGGIALWVMDSDGSAQVQLTDGTRNPNAPRWAPNSAAIAFSTIALGCSDVDCEGVDLYTMDATGRNLTNLTATTDRWLQAYAWSPDSEQIAASLSKSRSMDAYVIEVATGEHTPIITRLASEVVWDWWATP